MVSRFICTIHDDILEAIKVLRFDLVPGLVEEARVAGVRMESKLEEYKALRWELEKVKELKARKNRLMAEIKRLGKEIPNLQDCEDDEGLDWDELMED